MTLAYWTIALSAAALIGSFLNVVIHRGPAAWGLVDTDEPRGDLLRPRSYCPKCRTPIARRDLAPILSFVLLRGRCRHCGASIHPRYVVVELLAVMIAALAIAQFDFSPQAAFACLFGWFLLALAAIDAETGYLPDALTFPLLALGLIANGLEIFIAFADAVIGAIGGGAVFWALGAAWRRFRRVDALGLGDAKLLAGLGAWLGWQGLPLVVLIGSAATLLAIIVSRLAAGRGIQHDTPIPFGPGLAFAGAAIFAANAIGAM